MVSEISRDYCFWKVRHIERHNNIYAQNYENNLNFIVYISINTL